MATTYLTQPEIKTHLYDGVIGEINRADVTILQSAIDAAIEEAKGYLTAFDTNAIFATTGDERNPILLLYIKDISVWHYIQLANPNVDMELRKIRYEKAIEYLLRIQNGKVNPTLPYPATPPPGDAENYIKYGGNEKRTLNF